MNPKTPLSEREQQVFEALMENDAMGYKEIGFLLGLDARTIDTHKRRVVAKFECANVIQLHKRWAVMLDRLGRAA